MEQDGGGWRLDDVYYGNSPIGEPVNFIVHDIGLMTSMNETAQTADMLLAVGGTKPYEIPYSMRLLKRLETMET